MRAVTLGLLVLWCLLLLDSIGALAFKFNDQLEGWYSKALPSLQDALPLHTAWPYVYFGVSLLGVGTVGGWALEERQDR